MSFYSNVLFSIFYVISGSDDRGNPIPCIDVNKLIDWMVWETWLHFHFFKSGEVIISFGLRTTFFRYQLWLPRMTKSGKLRKRQLYHFLTSAHLLCFCFLLMFNTFFRYACTGVLVATPLGGNCYTKLNSSAPLTHPLPQPPPPPPQKTESLWSRRKQLTFAEIPKWKCFTTQIWAVLLIGCAIRIGWSKVPMLHDQALTSSGYCDTSSE